MSERLSNTRQLLSTIWAYRSQILPIVDRELRGWSRVARSMESIPLRKQAEASLHSKRFHCEGGSLLAANVPDRKRFLDPLVSLIVAFQTISDYLDNLCDRTESKSEIDFRQLHLALLDAAYTDARRHDYYRFHPHRKDGGYLDQLVRTCQQALLQLPSYHRVHEQVVHFVQLYSDLQTYKHLDPACRKEACQRWAESFKESYPGLQWQEFSAATGSTLIPFALFAAATKPDLDEKEISELLRAYFPWVTGLHILLDYFIDREEDEEFGDLNFFSFYRDRKEAMDRLSLFIERAREETVAMPFHNKLVQGLVVFYLSRKGTSFNDTRPLFVKAGLSQPMSWLLRKAGDRNKYI